MPYCEKNLPSEIKEWFVRGGGGLVWEPTWPLEYDRVEVTTFARQFRIEGEIKIDKWKEEQERD